MSVLEVSTGQRYHIKVIKVEAADFKVISNKRYFFNWNEEKAYEIVKLTLVDNKDILGLMSFEYIDTEKRIHVRLLAVSKENVGKNKVYDDIVGNLLTFAAKKAVLKYAEWACISLRPKTELVQHYIDKYKMNITGMTLSLEVPEILELINNYDHEA
ncbi:N-acetyltransferase [Olivibacter sp. XZL3]|uniref:N-acetyltransferase n=1 Tax=Olivibacter sp. XZL3 TaxID=1735116 RepID=UPI001065755D|nr:N-acetyltransferase [Olivibacter sp. XZL3]